MADKVLITGGLGFIGSNLAHRLVSQGSDVTLFTRTRNKAMNIKEIKDEVSIIEGDMKNFPSEIVTDQDVIFHFAGQVSHSASFKDPFYDLDINAKGTLQVLEACRQLNPKTHVIFPGTRGQYGKPEKLPVTEETPYDPLDLYGVSKTAAEYYCRLYWKIHGLPTTVIQNSNVFGPRQQINHGEYGILNFFIGLALQNKEISVYGDGSQIRDYNFVENIVDACLLIAKNKKAFGEKFLLGSGQGIKFIDMVETVIDAVGSGTHTSVPFPEFAKKIDVGDFVIDPSKARNIIGWEPKIGFKEGVKITADFYRERLQDYL